mmetsp:Transcript_9783/g.40093  ORF Transcript_9783/g.40093 Transcript_9783/m.40093 type:complete len:272 (+) Transcript_9783:69-884(+)
MVLNIAFVLVVSSRRPRRGYSPNLRLLFAHQRDRRGQRRQPPARLQRLKLPLPAVVLHRGVHPLQTHARGPARAVNLDQHAIRVVYAPVPRNQRVQSPVLVRAGVLPEQDDEYGGDVGGDGVESREGLVQLRSHRGAGEAHVAQRVSHQLLVGQRRRRLEQSRIRPRVAGSIPGGVLVLASRPGYSGRDERAHLALPRLGGGGDGPLLHLSGANLRSRLFHLSVSDPPRAGWDPRVSRVVPGGEVHPHGLALLRRGPFGDGRGPPGRGRRG